MKLQAGQIHQRAATQRAANRQDIVAADSARTHRVAEPAGLPTGEEFIQPSASLFAATILFMPKKDRGLRICIDYRALNRGTIKSRYPLPRADDLLNQLRGARFFSKIDLRGSYNQIRVFADDCHKTALRTRYGSYEYTMMPFGLTNAPSTSQLTMNGVF
ncbi:hypothetical protein CLOM_g24664 [Closterium sp. NIES-68]|nr:hypothetical protein CLOM_g24664 [Closterium sp. NIES-68]